MPRLAYKSSRASSRPRPPVDQSHRSQPPVQRTTRTDVEYGGDQLPQTTLGLHQRLQGMKEAIANVQAELDKAMAPVMSIPTRHGAQRTAAATTHITRSPRPMDDVAIAAMPASSRTMHTTGTRAMAPRFTGDRGDTATTALHVGQRTATARSRSPRPMVDAPAAAMSNRRPAQRTAAVAAAMSTRRPMQRTAELYKPLKTSAEYEPVNPQVIAASNIFNRFSLDHQTDINFMIVIGR